MQFPGVRIEFERPDGRRDVEDVEMTTLHARGAYGNHPWRRAPCRVAHVRAHTLIAREMRL
jgi:hypothetical protein